MEQTTLTPTRCFVRDLADSMTLRDGALCVAADQVSGWGWLPLGTAATADPV